MHRSPNRACRFWSLALSVVMMLALAAMAEAGGLNLIYERVIRDSNGNEIGYQKQTISSWEELPYGSPWRTFMTQLVGTRTVLDYTKAIAAQLNQPLTLTISDRNAISCSGKNSAGYNISLYRPVTTYSDQSSQRFVLLHELGHVAMLNVYPASYNFAGLSYGDDNKHYMDEILPNHKTSWVEGWANYFGGSKNGGYVFNLSMDTDSILNFLAGRTFDECNRNELFIGKTLYDASKQIANGQNKLFNIIGNTGPHNSMKEFLRAYLRAYPEDQVTLARIIDRNSRGSATVDELLDYLNGGSRTVSRSFYDFLVQRNNGQPVTAGGSSTSGGSSTTGGSTTTAGGSWWSRLASWFRGIFGGNTQTSSGFTMAAQHPTGTTTPDDTRPQEKSDGVLVTTMSAEMPTGPSLDGDAKSAGAGADLANLHEGYIRAFQAYNLALQGRTTNDPKVIEARERLQRAKRAFEAARPK